MGMFQFLVVAAKYDFQCNKNILSNDEQYKNNFL